MSDNKNWFIKQLKNMNIELSTKQLTQFEQYASLLIKWNERMNLTAITDLDGIYEKHFLDSLLVASDVDIKGKLADVGSGAGFPSIPLKIVFPALQVVIIEPLQKRCTFLKELVNVLCLEHVEIVNARAEDYITNHREAFDLVSARAVANLIMLSELCIPFVKVDGLFVAMKGMQAKQELEEAQYAIKTLGGIVQSTNYHDLNGNERYNILIHKIKKTSKVYPRAFAKIKKQPLRSVIHE